MVKLSIFLNVNLKVGQSVSSVKFKNSKFRRSQFPLQIFKLSFFLTLEPWFSGIYFQYTVRFSFACMNLRHSFSNELIKVVACINFYNFL
jgi:hypothetical protein